MKKKLLRWSLSIACILFLVKLFAYFYTHSQMILSDALEGIINIVASAFALFSVRWAAQPRDEDHPYGHGKIEFFAAGLEGALIIVASIGIIGVAAYCLIFQLSEVHQLDLGLGLTVLAGATNAIMGAILWKNGKQQQSIVLIAEGKHILSDSYSSLGVIIGLLVVHYTQLFWLDAVFSIGFGLYILFSGYFLVRTSIHHLLDKVNLTEIQGLVTIFNNNRRTTWVDVHNLRVIHYSDAIHIDCHLTFPRYWTVEMSELEQTHIEHLLEQNSAIPTDVFIHVDPCTNAHCTFCGVEICPIRSTHFTQLATWDAPTLMREANQVNVIS